MILDWQSTSRYDIKSSNEIGSEFARRPRFSNLLKDYNVPAGGTIALQVEVKGNRPFDLLIRIFEYFDLLYRYTSSGSKMVTR